MWYNSKRNYTTPSKLWWLTMLFAVSSILCASTLTDWGSIGAIVAAIVAVFLVIVQLIKHIKHNKLRKILLAELNELFTISPSAKTISASRKPQNVEIKLTASADVNVRFIVLSYEGKGETSKMQRVYEWNMPEGHESKYIEVIQLPDGGWNRTYHPPLLKKKGEHIKIGITCLAESSFWGKLIIYVACVENNKHLYLPFGVKDFQEQQDA